MAYVYIPDRNYLNHPAHSSTMLAILGVKHTPPQGMDAFYVHAIRVCDNGERFGVQVKLWVRPLAAKPEGETRRMFQGLRVRAECPLCHREVAAGRLAQHRCTK